MITFIKSVALGLVFIAGLGVLVSFGTLQFAPHHVETVQKDVAGSAYPYDEMVTVDRIQWVTAIDPSRYPQLSRAQCPSLRAGSPLRGNAVQCADGFAVDSHARSPREMVAHWEGRRYTNVPWLNVLHGGPTPHKILRQTVYLRRMLNLGEVGQGELLGDVREVRPRRVLVEMACGMAAVLYGLCPPAPPVELLCFGHDLVPAFIDDARSYFRYGTFTMGPSIPLLPSGAATHVISHGFLGIVHSNITCAHIIEGLRLLSSGGLLLAVMIGDGSGTQWATRLHPRFFNDSGAILPRCSTISGRRLDPLVSRVEFLFDYPSLPLYSAIRFHGTYVVRITRSDVPFEADGAPGNAQPTLPLDILSSFWHTYATAPIAERRAMLLRARDQRLTRLAEMWDATTRPRRPKRRK